jgi:hypothetical protein
MKNAKRFVICSDIHGDEQDADAVASCTHSATILSLQFASSMETSGTFRNLRKGASDDEKACEPRLRLAIAGMEFA